MPVTQVTLRDFRGYHRATTGLGTGVTVITGPNGAGKTNLLEGIYVGCTGRSCRTANDRELIRFGAAAARVLLSTAGADGNHELAIGIAPSEAKRMTVDGAPVEQMLDVSVRPLVSVFLPDRLELVKGVPAGRRAHLDQFVAALWPSRSLTRRRYAQALAQRNALLVRLRDPGVSRDSLRAWDGQVAALALTLMRDRREAVHEISLVYTSLAERLGLDAEPSIAYRPRSHAEDDAGFLAELHERLDGDIERGFTGHGPHRDDLVLRRAGRDLRTYGSQGQQRLGLLALLLAEREAIARHRDSAPLMLLDDVMSELDATRRAALVEVLATTPGQAVITATDRAHVPAEGPAVAHITVRDSELQGVAGCAIL